MGASASQLGKQGLDGVKVLLGVGGRFGEGDVKRRLLWGVVVIVLGGVGLGETKQRWLEWV